MNPEATYTTDKTPAYVTGIVAILLLIPIGYFIAKGLYIIAGFLAFLILAAIRFIVTGRQDYREVHIYSQYLTIGGDEGGVQTIYYTDITSVGFLHSAQFRNRMDRGQKFRSEQLIILLRGNGKLELPGDLRNAHDLCAIIQSRIAS
ncbi:MAG: hypothetical protein JST90_18250 [Bacteroidetes bacterium]|nr:hypothetical protein [Bacteroidota bacterium]